MAVGHTSGSLQLLQLSLQLDPYICRTDKYILTMHSSIAQHNQKPYNYLTNAFVQL